MTDVLVLGLETSTGQSSVALVGNDGVVASASLGVARRHGEFLAPAIRFCLTQAGVDVERVTGVAVGLGPGLYTGLRVGIATAQAFAAARDLPVVGLSGLDVIAFQARHVRRLICAVIDARRGELFWALYRAVPGGVQRQTELRVGTPPQLAAELEAAGEDCLVIGDGLARARDDLRRVGVDASDLFDASPDAAHLAELAVPRFEREETTRPTDLLPIYLRQADAKIGWETRGRLRGGEAS
ncbi:tRNA (adenosine(37)-N6)-threonylcarbamoyltransferase complex dimerization subunit type 1 TsaB [Egicoccus sp. AB-alg2]|uniref:tRNA (adenosine(37)-N6)-threonylcarbamoyltransferase complex dimerization subunit type 1 TsaB n=1 Tax=Egicoccus sp. AB-alg2 TaxID=3242693 RepID=UPI00359EB42A